MSAIVDASTLASVLLSPIMVIGQFVTGRMMYGRGDSCLVVCHLGVLLLLEPHSANNANPKSQNLRTYVRKFWVVNASMLLTNRKRRR